jgi:hypothetical protein
MTPLLQNHGMFPPMLKLDRGRWYGVVQSPYSMITHLGTRSMEQSPSRVSHIAIDSQSVCLGVEPRLGLMTRYSFLIESYSPVHMGRPL